MFLECTIIGSETPLIEPVSIITSSMSFCPGRSNIVFNNAFSKIDRKPLAPVFLFIALFAISLTESSLNVSLTPSSLNSSWYCFIKEFFGSNKIFIKANKNSVGKYFYSLLDNRTYKLVDTAKGTDLVPLGSLDTEGENQPSEGDLGFEQTEYQKEIARKTEEALKRKKEEQRKKVLESLPSNAFDEGF